MRRQFSAYFDDSGHPDDQRAVVVGGFLASDEQWLGFDQEWTATLSKYGVSVFHMTDFEREIGEFAGWKPKKRQKFLDQLLGVINRQTSWPVSEAVLMGDYKRINDIFPFEEYFGAPYALVGRSLCGKLNRWKEENAALNPQLLVFFEDGTKHKGDFQEAMKRDGLAPPSFLDKASTPLQAADLLSWEIFNGLRTGALLRTGLVRPSLDVLVGTPKKKRFQSLYKLIDLQRMCESRGVPRRENIRQDVHIAYRHSPKRRRRRTVGKNKSRKRSPG